MANVVIWARTFHVAVLARVRHCTWENSIYTYSGLKSQARTHTVQNDPDSADHYEYCGRPRFSSRAGNRRRDRKLHGFQKVHHTVFINDLAIDTRSIVPTGLNQSPCCIGPSTMRPLLQVRK
jgi:hypothetical protein